MSSGWLYSGMPLGKHIMLKELVQELIGGDGECKIKDHVRVEDLREVERQKEEEKQERKRRGKRDERQDAKRQRRERTIEEL